MCCGGCIVKVLIGCLQKTEIDLVQGIAKRLLWELISVWSCIGSEYDPVLISIEESARRAGLPAKFIEPGGDVHMHVLK